MAEFDDNETGVGQEFEGSAERLESAAETYTNTTENLNQALSNLGVGQQILSDLGSQNLASAAANLSSVGVATEQVTRQLSSLSQANEKLSQSRPDSSLHGTNRALSAVSGGFQSLGKIGQQSSEFLQKNIKNMQESFASGVALFALSQIEDKIRSLGDSTKINAIQKQLSNFEKTAMQASIGFGSSFEDATGSINFMHQTIAQTILTTKRMPEDILKVRESLKSAFGGTQLTENIDRLNDSNVKLSSAVNITNIALLTSSATGMEATAVADLMSKAHLELGESVDDAGSALGEIAIVAEKSGMQFERVAKSITDSANTLKMWGGTVGAVTPMFEAFSKSLGEGRKGLATDMIQKFTSGLENMGLNVRALMGLQMPGGAGKGAIGAGLEMEAALEGGAGGMQKVSESLITTLKQFGGGRVVTRQEAIENPALERNFLIQRQLLKQMMGVDTATGTRMLGALQDIDEHGLSIGKDSDKALAEMMGKGESVQDKATTTLEKAQLATKAAIETHGAKILDRLDNMADQTGVGKLAGAIEAIVTKSAKTGTLDVESIKGVLKEQNIDISKIFSSDAVGAVAQSLGFRGDTPTQKKDDVSQRQPETQKTGIPYLDVLPGLLNETQQRIGQGKQLTDEDIKQTIEGRIDVIEKTEGPITIEDQGLLETFKNHGDTMVRVTKEYSDSSMSLGQFSESLKIWGGENKSADERLSQLSELFRSQPEQIQETRTTERPQKDISLKIDKEQKEDTSMLKELSDWVNKITGMRKNKEEFKPSMVDTKPLIEERKQEQTRLYEDTPRMTGRDFFRSEQELPKFRQLNLPIQEAQVVTKEIRQIEQKITAQTQFEPLEIEAKLKITPDQSTITIQPDAEFIELIARGQIVNNIE